MADARGAKDRASRLVPGQWQNFPIIESFAAHGP
jgi:hypothetical protein